MTEEAIPLKMRDTCKTIRCPYCGFMILPDDNLSEWQGSYYHTVCLQKVEVIVRLDPNMVVKTIIDRITMNPCSCISCQHLKHIKIQKQFDRYDVQFVIAFAQDCSCALCTWILKSHKMRMKATDARIIT